jgi:hypothetical protein
MFGWDRYGFHKKSIRTRYAELVFLHLVRSVGHVLHFGLSVARNVNTLFFVLRWALCSFHKNRGGTCFTEIMFLHPVGYAGHVVHSVAPGARNIDALLFLF